MFSCTRTGGQREARRDAVLLLAFGIGLLGLFAGSVRAENSLSAKDAPALARIQGDWRLDPSPEAAAARAKTIDAAVEQLPWLVRVFAAPILHKSTSPPIRLQFFAVDGKGWFQRAIGPDSDRIQPVNLGGGPQDHVDPRGEPFRASWDSTATGGVQNRWEQSQAMGENQYHLEPETGQLVVEQTIQVTAIADVLPIVLVSRFDRQTASVRSEGSEDRVETDD